MEAVTGPWVYAGTGRMEIIWVIYYLIYRAWCDIILFLACIQWISILNPVFVWLLCFRCIFLCFSTFLFSSVVSFFWKSMATFNFSQAYFSRPAACSVTISNTSFITWSNVTIQPNKDRCVRRFNYLFIISAIWRMYVLQYIYIYIYINQRYIHQ